MEVFGGASQDISPTGLSSEEQGYWIAFNRILGIGPVKLRLLLTYFQGDLALAWRADSRELARAGLPPKISEKFLAQRGKIEPARELALLAKEGLSLLTWRDPAYPALLREIDVSPPVLYIRGTLNDADRFALAVVGTRTVSSYGQQAAEHLVTELARGQITIVSGLALGVDTIAHTAALEAGGRTIAVLANGLDTIYPAQNCGLARRIVESGQGVLMSEYPLGMRPDSGNFPARNRIISGISQSVLVVEAGIKSGALITAEFASRQGREVFAVPGSIFSSRSSGSNKLIRDGAHLVANVGDILDALNLFMVPQQVEVQMALPENADERSLLALLSREPVHIDELINSSQLPTPTVTATLTMLQLKGLIRSIGSAQFVLAH